MKYLSYSLATLMIFIAPAIGLASPRSADSGISGTARSTPATGCNHPVTFIIGPATHVSIKIYRTNEKLIKTVNTGTSSNFKISLDPGSYIIRATDDGHSRFLRAIKVKAGHFSSFQIILPRSC